MKVLYVTSLCLQNGRGPVFRFTHIMPFLARQVSLEIWALDQPDPDTLAQINQLRIPMQYCELVSDGWFLMNKMDVSVKIHDYAESNGFDLVILGWEYWDLATGLLDHKKNASYRFAVVIHSMPFLDALPNPGIFWEDYQKRENEDINPMIRSYLKARRHEIFHYVQQLDLISINETVTYYLNHYFPEKEVNTAHPGYALSLKEIGDISIENRIFDFCFMARLERSKGIFDLIEVLAIINTQMPKARIKIIGSFVYKKERELFYLLLKEKNLKGMVEVTGWLAGDEKYLALKQCKVFLYPSISGDTFSFCLLEAMACGLTPICYDTPFARLIYGESSVRKIELRDIKLMAQAATNATMEFKEETMRKMRNFLVEKYDSWDRVAQAELRAFQIIMEK
jgi:glycosyltransferase involved in cell wall biosynthesis